MPESLLTILKFCFLALLYLFFFRVLRAVWDNTYGLLVDDGQLAIGAIVALAVTWVIAETSAEPARENAGWALLALTCALVVVNIYRAGRSARRRAA